MTSGTDLLIVTCCYFEVQAEILYFSKFLVVMLFMTATEKKLEYIASAKDIDYLRHELCERNTLFFVWLVYFVLTYFGSPYTFTQRPQSLIWEETRYIQPVSNEIYLYRPHFSPYKDKESLCLSVCLCLSLSLSHTHTYTCTHKHIHTHVLTHTHIHTH